MSFLSSRTRASILMFEKHFRMGHCKSLINPCSVGVSQRPVSQQQQSELPGAVFNRSEPVTIGTLGVAKPIRTQRRYSSVPQSSVTI